jgi:hypothetical protein
VAAALLLPVLLLVPVLVPRLTRPLGGDATAKRSPAAAERGGWARDASTGSVPNGRPQTRTEKAEAET